MAAPPAEVIEFDAGVEVVGRPRPGGQRRGGDHGTFGESGDELDLAVAVGMIVVGGLHGDAQAAQGDEGCGDVDQAFHGIDEDDAGAGEGEGQRFDQHQGDAAEQHQEQEAGIGPSSCAESWRRISHERHCRRRGLPLTRGKASIWLSKTAIAASRRTDG